MYGSVCYRAEGLDYVLHYGALVPQTTTMSVSMRIVVFSVDVRGIRLFVLTCMCVFEC